MINKKIPGYGVVTAMLTPLQQDETVDVASVKKLVNRMTDAGIHGIFTMATSGECMRLPPEQQDLLIKTVAETNQGKSTLYIGVSACGTAEAIRNIRRAEQAGADVIVSTLPFYYNSITVREQVEFYKALAQSTALPILMYNIPSNVGGKIEIETARLLRDEANIVGIKDSSGDLDYFNALLQLQRDDFRVLSGVEFHCTQALKQGASGIVPSLSNIYPNAYMQLWEYIQQKDFEKADILQNKFNRINNIHKQYSSRLAVMTCRKVLLEYEGLGNAYMTHPYTPVPEDLKKLLLQTATDLQLN